MFLKIVLCLSSGKEKHAKIQTQLAGEEERKRHLARLVFVTYKSFGSLFNCSSLLTDERRRRILFEVLIEFLEISSVES